ncbi:hypothetical protein OB2597_06485 [Pseudooceanicola batsensis HTCC2597]|uniref:Neutral zinc metallopeptidase n=1 Tax=Pseudooceanicola batsensis (strain ATCC BAA-863 / DSM 15984 / KCTC 12145 / HTCC2597) TaxID=252305 RepID=A3TTD2_PSEBH|nr:metallopeptidase family protein [Pseudooceanicola batsensis]EAQ04909.1 hypothetical protein OB2597_06485 [Pseudooceanicola batsensis HTCC2597]
MCAIPSGRPPRDAAGADHSAEYFLTVARRAVDGFPAAFRPAAQEVRIIVAEQAEPEMLNDLGMADPLDLTGLYEGIPVTEKSTWDIVEQPDTVWLFRAAILHEWRDRGDVALDDLITHVTVHEFAHHFGWSDAAIAEIDPWWE